MERLLPRDGDVLVSHPMARVECEIAVVPRPPHAVNEKHAAALASATMLASNLGVDVWLTHDRRHFLRVASFRQVSEPPREDSAAAREPDAQAMPRHASR